MSAIPIVHQPGLEHNHRVPDLTTALLEARREHFVFPVQAFDKTPYQFNGYPLAWSGAATCDLGEIRERGWPEGANVGIACKQSGLLIIDTDDHGGANGIKAFTQLCEEHEPDGDWPDTRIVETPTGGLHFYFANPDPDRYGNGTGGLPKGIDVRGGGRGDGGYVLAAGSVCDRRAYEGKPDLQALVGDGREYTIYNDAPVLKAPDWLLEMLHQKPRRKRTSGEACHALLLEWPSVTQARLNAELSRIKHLEPGALRPGRDDDKAGRNNQLHESACRFGEVVAIGRIDIEKAREQLLEAAETCGLVDDDGEYRVNATIDSGLAKGAADLIGGN